ncbi:hypothetical protein QFZ37_003800 [Chryseobacterium ginsenosidimutans]|nr:hypothetical protein [Chryseobacterium ginsenosidimutans]
MTLGVTTSESGVGLFILLAIASKLVIDEIMNTPLPTLQRIPIIRTS